jgi:ferritin
MKIQIPKELNPQVETKLQSNIKIEYDSASIYEGMSAWLDYKGFANTSKFFKTHAGEERKHGSWVITYLEDKNVMPLIPAVDAPDYSWQSLKDVLEGAYKHEEKIALHWNETATMALKFADHDSYQFALKMLAEQREEIALFAGLIDRYNLSEGGPQSDYLFDSEIVHP